MALVPQLVPSLVVLRVGMTVRIGLQGMEGIVIEVRGDRALLVLTQTGGMQWADCSTLVIVSEIVEPPRNRDFDPMTDPHPAFVALRESACQNTLVLTPEKPKDRSTRIDGWDVSLFFETERDGSIVSSCHIGKKGGRRFRDSWVASLGLAEDMGLIESNDGKDPLPISDATLKRIHDWATEHGY